MALVIVTSDFNAKLSYLTETEKHIVPADRLDNADHPTQFCSDHIMFLGRTSFVIKGDIYSPPHVIVGHQLRGSIENR